MSSAVMGYPVPRAGGTDLSHMAKIGQTNRPDGDTTRIHERNLARHLLKTVGDGHPIFDS